MSITDLLAHLDALPRLGWVDAPTPVTPLDGLAGELGLEWLGAKRDDGIEALHGGSKVRKLDSLLASAPFADAPGWVGTGAIGSGQLVALTAAAARLGRRVEALTFWEPLSLGVEENLAFTASGPTALRYHRSRVTLALRRPRALLGGAIAGLPVVPPGATAPAGIVGMVRGGLELAAQVAAGVLPPPHRVLVPLGSGGTVAGIALGLGMAGLRPEIHAVTAVERLLATQGRMERLIAAARRWLVAAGVEAAASAPLPPVHIDRSQIGPGYGIPTEASRAAAERLRALGVPLEPVYSGKTMAALLAGAVRPGERVLFWVTPRRADPLPVADDWRERLPPALRRRLTAVARRGPSRRRVVFTGVALAGAAAAGYRLGGYPDVPGWRGAVLSAREAHIVTAAAEALLPPAPGPYEAIAARVDRYLRAFPPRMQREIHLMLFGLEQGTPVLGLRLPRLTRLAPVERAAFLADLDRRGGLLRQMYRGLRDLCMLGYYQRPETWGALGYRGPMVGPDRRPSPYDALAAPAGQPPPGWQAWAG